MVVYSYQDFVEIFGSKYIRIYSYDDYVIFKWRLSDNVVFEITQNDSYEEVIEARFYWRNEDGARCDIRFESFLEKNLLSLTQEIQYSILINLHIFLDLKAKMIII